jgi:Tfp pilus assembly protein FimT
MAVHVAAAYDRVGVVLDLVQGGQQFSDDQVDALLSLPLPEPPNIIRQQQQQAQLGRLHAQLTQARYKHGQTRHVSYDLGQGSTDSSSDDDAGSSVYPGQRHTPQEGEVAYSLDLREEVGGGTEDQLAVYHQPPLHVVPHHYPIHHTGDGEFKTAEVFVERRKCMLSVSPACTAQCLTSPASAF